MATILSPIVVTLLSLGFCLFCFFVGDKNFTVSFYLIIAGLVALASFAFWGITLINPSFWVVLSATIVVPVIAYFVLLIISNMVDDPMSMQVFYELILVSTFLTEISIWMVWGIIKIFL
jgi:hypothetical protein